MNSRWTLGVVVIAVTAAGCGSDTPTASNATFTISGTIGGLTALSLRATPLRDHTLEKLWSLEASSASDYQMSCSTLEVDAKNKTAVLGADGTFSVEVNGDTPFSCVVDTVAEDGNVLAVVKVEDPSRTSLSGDTVSLSTMAIKDNVDAGTLTIGSDSAVKIPVEKISAASSTGLSAIAAADLHNKYFKVYCLDNGNPKDLKRCKQKYTCDWTVGGNGQPKQYAVNFMRVWTETQDASEVTMLGIWKGATSFADCGSKDISAGLRTAYGLTANGSDDWAYGASCMHKMAEQWGMGFRYANADFTEDTLLNWKKPGSLNLVEKIEITPDGSWNAVQHNRTRTPNTCGFDTVIYYNFSKSQDAAYDLIGVAEAVGSGAGDNPCGPDFEGVDSFLVGYKAVTEAEAAVAIPNDTSAADCMSF